MNFVLRPVLGFNVWLSMALFDATRAYKVNISQLRKKPIAQTSPGDKDPINQRNVAQGQHYHLPSHSLHDANVTFIF